MPIVLVDRIACSMRCDGRNIVYVDVIVPRQETSQTFGSLEVERHPRVAITYHSLESLDRMSDMGDVKGERKKVLVMGALNSNLVQDVITDPRLV